MKCSLFVDRLTMGTGRWPTAVIRSMEFKPDDGYPTDGTVTLFLDDEELKDFADSIYAHLRKTAGAAQAKAAALVAGIPEEGESDGH